VTKTKLSNPKPWEQLLDDADFKKQLTNDILERYILRQRWYGGKSSTLKYLEISEFFTIEYNGDHFYGLLLEVNFKEAFYQHYFLPLGFVVDKSAAKEGLIAPIQLGETKGYLVDALYLDSFRKVLFEKIIESKPEILVLIPCGYYTEDILRQLPNTKFPESFKEIPAFQNDEIWALDATSYFSRPAPRVVDGVEILAKIFHPEIFGELSETEAVKVSILERGRLVRQRAKRCCKPSHSSIVLAM
jgi:hypothetical protein